MYMYKQIQQQSLTQYITINKQGIADSWPDTIDDSTAQQQWGWKPYYTIDSMSKHMLDILGKRL